MDSGIEGLVGCAELLQAQLDQGILKCLANTLESALEFAMFTGPIYIIHNRQQGRNDRANCHLFDEFPVAIDSAAIIRILSMDSLEIIRQFSQLALDAGDVTLNNGCIIAAGCASHVWLAHLPCLLGFNRLTKGEGLRIKTTLVRHPNPMNLAILITLLIH